MKITELSSPPFEIAYFLNKLKVISGGQNGVDQAGLRAAALNGIETGGWAPGDWITLDGPKQKLLQSFGLEEAKKAGYAYRTELNVKHSDLTLRIATDISSSGEKCTYRAIAKHKKPFIDFAVPKDLTRENANKLAQHIIFSGYYIINIAGNSEKTSPGIGKQAEDFLNLTFNFIKNIQ